MKILLFLNASRWIKISNPAIIFKQYKNMLVSNRKSIICNYRLFLLVFLIFITIYLSLFTTTNCQAQFSFAHISDTHVADGVSAPPYDLNGVMFNQVITAFNQMNPKLAFVINTGDVSNSGNGVPYGMYPALTQHLFPALVAYPQQDDYFIDSAKTIPMYFTPGNHDYRSGNIPPLSNSTLTYYSQYIAPDTDYFFVYENAVFILLRSGWDDNRPIWEDTNPLNPEGSGLTDSQITWLRNVLHTNSNKRKMIFMHHPPVDAVGTNTDGTPFTGTVLDTADGSILNNRTEFLNICDSNNVDAVFCGHEHQNVVAIRNGTVVNENWTGTVRYVQTTTCTEGGYRIVTVYPDSVHISNPQVINLNGTQGYALNTAGETLNITYHSQQNLIKVANNNPNTCINAGIDLYNTTGQKLYNQSVLLSQGNHIIISTIGYKKGLYILVAHTRDKVVCTKILIY